MSRVVKLIAGVVVVLVIVAAVVVVTRHKSGYVVKVTMADAGGLQNGSDVNVDGVTVGRVDGLTITRGDRALATLRLNRTAAPIGTGATASVEIDGFFGERLINLTRGAYKTHPEPSGTAAIGLKNSSVSVRLDDVLDSLDMNAQGALTTFLDEDGEALVGRGQDLRNVIGQLPQTLPALTTLLSQFSSNQQALGQLVDRSDQVVTEVAGQRAYLAGLVNSANSALGALASRRNQLGTTIQRAPGALAQAQTTMAQLRGTAIPLSPAADGLKATVPSLLTALRQVPSFTKAAVPTLNEVAKVSPALDRLASYGTPIISRIVPLARTLTSYTQQGLSPLLDLLSNQGGAANLFGEMEGWARSTQGYDASGHIFRFGATTSPATFAALLSSLSVPGLPPLKKTPASTSTSTSTATSAPSASSAPATTAGTPTSPVSGVTSTLGNVLSTVGGGLQGTVTKVTGTVNGVVSKVTGGSGTATTSQTTSTAQATGLLNYLLGK